MYGVVEAKATNTRMLAYDPAHGFNIQGFVGFSPKRSIMVKCGSQENLCHVSF
jgi:hypothetical protein